MEDCVPNIRPKIICVIFSKYWIQEILIILQDLNTSNSH
jgi:hypothetical protein